MNEDLKDVLTIVTATLFGIAALVVLLGSLSIMIERAACDRVAAISRVNVRYDWLAGCFVELDGQYVPIKRWLRLQKESPKE